MGIVVQTPSMPETSQNSANQSHLVHLMDLSEMKASYLLISTLLLHCIQSF